MIPNNGMIQQKILAEADRYKDLYSANSEVMPRLQMENVKWVS